MPLGADNDAGLHLQLLQELCVSYNNVNGTLPRPYNRLSNLKKFDVAYNNITGRIRMQQRVHLCVTAARQCRKYS